MNQRLGILRKLTLMLSLLGLGIASAQIEARSEFTKVQWANPVEKCVIKGLERDISSIQIEIQETYEDMLDDPCKSEEGGDPRNMFCNFYRIGKANQKAIIPLTADKISRYGDRRKYFVYEYGTIQWSGKKISGFEFVIRNAQFGGGIKIKKISAVARIPEKDLGSLDVEDCLKLPVAEQKQAGPPINYFIKEVLQSGRGNIFIFRFPNRKDVETITESVISKGVRVNREVSYVRDKIEEMDLDGQKTRVRVSYLRDVGGRIKVLREYLRLLKLMHRRIDWNTRGQMIRQVRDVARSLKGPNN